MRGRPLILTRVDGGLFGSYEKAPAGGVIYYPFGAAPDDVGPRGAPRWDRLTIDAVLVYESPSLVWYAEPASA